MKTIQANGQRTLSLGRVGEDERTEIVFDISDVASEFPSGSVTLVHRCPNDTDAHPVTVVRNGNNVVWTVADDELSADGYGECQLTYSFTDGRSKSKIWQTVIGRSLVNNGTAPAPYTSWLDNLTTLANQTQTNATKAETALTTLENKIASGDFKGEKGDPGERGPSGEKGDPGERGPAGQNGQNGRDGSDASVTSSNIAFALGYTPVSESSVTSLSEQISDCVKGIQIDSVDLDKDSNGKVSIPKAEIGTGKFGIVGLGDSNLGLESTSTGLLKTNPASTSNIDSRSSGYKPIVPTTLNYAVKATLTDEKRIELTDSEKATAQSVFGVDKIADQVDDNRKDIDRIMEFDAGNTFTYSTDTDNAYSKRVPANAKRANVDEIGGRSVVWNRLCEAKNATDMSVFKSKNTDPVYSEGVWSTSFTRDVALGEYGYNFCPLLSESTTNAVGHIKKDHTYYAHCYIKYSNDGHKCGVLFRGSSSSSGTLISNGYFVIADNVSAGEWVLLNGIKTASEDHVTIAVRTFTNESSWVARETVEYKEYWYFDLTQMYGAGNEPTSTDDPRIAEIEAYAKLHPEYNAGSLISANVTKINSVGINKLKTLTNTDITTLKTSGGVNRKGYAFIPAVDMTIKAFRKIDYSSSTNVNLMEYDNGYGEAATKVTTFVTTSGISGPFTLAAGKKYGIVPSLNVTSSSVKAINYAQIMLVEGNVAPTVYSPYKSTDITIPQSVRTQYPLHSAGLVHDSYEFDGEKWWHFKRTGYIEMSDLTFDSYDSSYTRSRFNAPSDMYCNTINRYTEIVTPIYKTMKDREAITDVGDLSIYGGVQNDLKYVWIHDARIVSSDTATQYLDGKYMTYVLEEYVITDITDLMNANGILDVEAGGTITFVQDGTEFAIPNSVTYTVKNNLAERVDSMPTAVQVNGVDLVKDANGKINIPKAELGASKLGLISLGSNSLGFEITPSGDLKTNPASTANIDSRGSGYKPIVPVNLNYAVKATLTDDNRITGLTDTEKSNACEVIGAERAKGEWVLKGTLTTETKSNGVTVDLTGCTELYIDSSTTGTGNCAMYANGDSFLSYIAINGNRKARAVFKDYIDGFVPISAKYSSNLSAVTLLGNLDAIVSIGKKISQIARFSTSSPSVITSCDIKIYAR